MARQRISVSKRKLTGESNEINLLLITILLVHTLNAGELTNNELQSMIVVANDSSMPLKAIAVATQQQNSEILVYAINNPSWDVRSCAVDAIGKLPKNKAKDALAAILQIDHLWQSHVKGGEGQIVQDHFNAILLDTIFRVFGIDGRGMDIFEFNNRKNLISAIQNR